MNILDIQVLNGPNFWSNHRKKLIVLTLDLEKYEQLPTHLLPGFYESLIKLIPSLSEHRCSVGIPGGFFKRLEEGTWLGHVIEHVALELQTLAGMDCGFGRTFSAAKIGVYDVIFAYKLENAGIYAANTAFKIVSCLAAGDVYHELEHDLNELRCMYEKEKLGPSMESIVQAAVKRQIPITKAKDNSFIILGHGCNQKKIWDTVSSQTSSIGVDIAANKELTKNILESHLIPVPKGMKINSLEELDHAIEQLGFPLVIKPLDGNHGRGVLTHISSKEKAILGFELAKQISSDVIVERLVQGDDYRFLVINYQLVAAAKRTPAMVVGTGTHSIQQLIDRANEDPKRGMAHENVLTTIKIDDTTLSLLMEKNLSLDSIVAKDEIVYLKGTANLSSGGTATDVTDLVHPANIKLVERIARLINLDICGIDIVAKTIDEPIHSENGGVIEVNAGPGFRMHLSPTEGKPRDVASPVITMLYPLDTTATIPLVAVTGTSGKTTVVRLIAHFAKQANYHVGFTTSEAIYNHDQLVYSGDCGGGSSSVAAVLLDPLVDFAILECSREEILRCGLGFDECDISIIMNISSDHLKEIHTLDELIRIKAVVAYSTKRNGYAILNADDERVYALKNDLKCKIALFGIHENSYIQEHCFKGGLACYIEDDFVIVHEGENKHSMLQISNIPLAFTGTASSMIQNILPAVLAGVISNFPKFSKVIPGSIRDYIY